MLSENDLMQIICDCGAAAVLKVRVTHGLANDNEFREETVSSLMHLELFERLKTIVRTEMAYTAILKTHGQEITETSRNRVGAKRADIVVFGEHSSLAKPIAVIEVKKFAEGGRKAQIASDLIKGSEVFLNRYVDVYSAIFIAATYSQGLAARQAVLEDMIGSTPKFSDPQKALNGWEWSFGCFKVPKIFDQSLTSSVIGI